MVQFLPESTCTLLLETMGDPFLNQVKVGGGVPEASQSRVRGLLRRVLVFSADPISPRIAGGTDHTHTMYTQFSL